MVDKLPTQTQKHLPKPFFVYGSTRDDDDSGNTWTAKFIQDYIKAIDAKIYGYKIYKHIDQNFPFSIKTNDPKDFVVGRMLEFEKDIFSQKLTLADHINGYDPNQNENDNYYHRVIVDAYLHNNNPTKIVKAIAYIQNIGTTELSKCIEIPFNDWMKRHTLNRIDVNSSDVNTESKNAYQTDIKMDDNTVYVDNTVHVNNKRQAYILSNYSTLPINSKWNNNIISSMIDKISKIRILPPSIKYDNMHIYRDEYVLKTTINNLKNPLKSKYNTEYTNNDKIDIKSSCESIINYVNLRSKHDPLLSHNNPFKKEQKKDILEEEQKYINKDRLSIARTKTEQLDLLDVTIDDYKHADDEFSEDYEIVDKLKDDACYQMLQEVITRSDLKHNLTNTNRIEPQILDKQREIHSYSYLFKQFLKYTYLLGGRAFGLSDVITDIYLLYLFSQHENLYLLTLTLIISIASPYIINYSSGVQSYSSVQLYDNLTGFREILMFLFVLPTGIFYFIFLDLTDVVLRLSYWLDLVLCCRFHNIKHTEQIISDQLGISRMYRKGIKRQRMIGQLMFESLPQCIYIFCI